jgi:uncharacterized protein
VRVEVRRFCLSVPAVLTEDYPVDQERERYSAARSAPASNGTSVGGQDDRDEMGICVEPPEYVIGLRAFDQYEYHTAWERPGGLRERSGPGDLDETEITAITDFGRELRELRELAPSIVSRQAGHRFAGYLRAQRRGLLSHQGKGPRCHPARADRAVRLGHKIWRAHDSLGIQGIELLLTGRLTLPMAAGDAQFIRDIRTGIHTMESVLAEAERLEDRLRALIETSPLPEYPDRDAADAWLVSTYQRAWTEKALWWHDAS